MEIVSKQHIKYEPSELASKRYIRYAPSILHSIGPSQRIHLDFEKYNDLATGPKIDDISDFVFLYNWIHYS